MAGHSKWHNIQHRKGAQDAARGKIFTKHAKLIAIAAKNDPNPDTNPTLKQAIASAKADNVPNDNITRALKKASGEGKDAVNYQELQYEGYAPGGVALIIEALSDNSNRTYTSVRTTVDKNGGNLGSSGTVSWMFENKGFLEVVCNESEETEMEIIEAGAEDLEYNEDRFLVTTDLNNLNQVRDSLLEKNFEVKNVKKQQVPTNTTEIDEQKAEKLFKLIDKINEDDDVTDVWNNAIISS